ncbi:hypothetical protein MVI01_47710 [Myxococcus virescens]|uniref:Transposase IS4-like domain-containing protein n=1 Tax=Myxococcus virescens TaxID=83456 RepID=A0A511HHC3_9BACT|nr:hypothetical protein MVI01_47710 [Myxococcus virescens]
MDLTDEQWSLIEPLLPARKPSRHWRGKRFSPRNQAPRCPLDESLIGDKAYDADKLDERLWHQRGVKLIAPHRRGRKTKTQDGRELRRYRRRWKMERLFAWLQNFRRLVTRYEVKVENFLGFLHLG